MKIRSVVIDTAVTVIMARMAEVDVFVLGAQERNRPHSDDRLPRRLVIIEIAGKPVRGVVASDRGIAYAGANIKSGQIVCQSRSRSSAFANAKSCQQGSSNRPHQRLHYNNCPFDPASS